MNKLMKGAIAGAAGVALLLGGAGTLASWTGSAAVAGGTIVAGNLKVASSATPATWSINGGPARPNLTGYLAVPGDTIVYTKPMAITATGENLFATLSLSAGSIAPRTPKNLADVALSEQLKATAVIQASGEGISQETKIPQTFTVAAGKAGVVRDVTVVVTLTFPTSVDPGTENASKTGAVTLSNFAVSLAQFTPVQVTPGPVAPVQ